MGTLKNKCVESTFVKPSSTQDLTAEKLVVLILNRIETEPEEYEMLCRFLEETEGMDLVLKKIQSKSNKNVNKD